jgi:hypothetical protein
MIGRGGAEGGVEKGENPPPPMACGRHPLKVSEKEKKKTSRKRRGRLIKS